MPRGFDQAARSRARPAPAMRRIPRRTAWAVGAWRAERAVVCRATAVSSCFCRRWPTPPCGTAIEGYMSGREASLRARNRPGGAVPEMLGPEASPGGARAHEPRLRPLPPGAGGVPAARHRPGAGPAPSGACACSGQAAMPLRREIPATCAAGIRPPRKGVDPNTPHLRARSLGARGWLGAASRSLRLSYVPRLTLPLSDRRVKPPTRGRLAPRTGCAQASNLGRAPTPLRVPGPARSGRNVGPRSPSPARKILTEIRSESTDRGDQGG
jgi:hypothetical protein